MKKAGIIIALMVCFHWAKAQQRLPKPAMAAGFTPIHLINNKIPVANNFFILPVTGNYYTQHLSFFCKMEWKAEKKIKFPLRLRLGSVEYTDYMEQKPNTYFFGK